jgi:GNAT superfamily N-acetyltransferase
MYYCLAGLSDAERIAELRWISNTEDNENKDERYEEYIERTTKFIIKGIEEKTWHYWIAKENDMIIGIIAIYVFERMPAPGRRHAYNGYITNVYVRKEYRNRKIGKGLITKVKEWACKMNINVLMLYSSNEAVNFYKREGFTTNNEFYNLILNDE